MHRRRPVLPHDSLYPDILPEDFVERHDLIQRLYLTPLRGMTEPSPWAPLTDAEWEVLRPLLPGTVQGGPGRPLPDPRARLDAIFRAVTLKAADGFRATWTALPEAFGRHGTISRLFRRWAHLGLWSKLLMLVADRDGAPPDPVLLGLRYRACCAFRRAYRLLGMRGILLARRLGLFSALPAPSSALPDPDLSRIYCGAISAAIQRMLAGMWRDPTGVLWPGWRPSRAALRGIADLHAVAGGVGRITRRMEPA